MSEQEEPEEAFEDLGSGTEAGDVGENPIHLHPADEPVENPKETRDRDLNRPAYDFLLDEDKKKQFSKTPSYADQYSRYPETVRTVGPMIRVFDLADANDLTEMNKLMTGFQNHNAPRSVAEIVDKQWDEKTGNWKMLMRVTEFMYLKIIERDED